MLYSDVKVENKPKKCTEIKSEVYKVDLNEYAVHIVQLTCKVCTIASTRILPGLCWSYDVVVVKTLALHGVRREPAPPNCPMTSMCPLWHVNVPLKGML